ncbi:hypothetical protein BDV93DRAFT_550526 [Ceratobasidium sp. AG-I]|nr:hypothetical protein BDV93DRAFT_550526 [Ceratobasidium sp. AG-I]
MSWRAPFCLCSSRFLHLPNDEVFEDAGEHVPRKCSLLKSLGPDDFLDFWTAEKQASLPSRDYCFGVAILPSIRGAQSPQDASSPGRAIYLHLCLQSNLMGEGAPASVAETRHCGQAVAPDPFHAVPRVASGRPEGRGGRTCNPDPAHFVVVLTSIGI